MIENRFAGKGNPQIAKVDVAGSNPVSRSNRSPWKQGLFFARNRRNWPWVTAEGVGTQQRVTTETP